MVEDEATGKKRTRALGVHRSTDDRNELLTILWCLMAELVAATLFVVALVALNRYLRRRDVAGYWDRDWRSAAARPGLRRFFDFKDDGLNQGPVRRHGWP
jgi:hypothetical protein